MTGWFIVATVKDTAEKIFAWIYFQYFNQAPKLWDLIGNENPCRTTIQRWTDPLYRYMVLRSLEIRGLEHTPGIRWACPIMLTFSQN